MRRQWLVHPQEMELARSLAGRLDVHPLVGQLLVNRRVRTVQEGQRFLDRRLGNLHDPDLLPGASEAADRIHQAVLAGRRLCIYGDYDVDGMCATAILLRCLRVAGASARFHIPDRLEEGYGVKADALARLRQEGVDLVVTVDCGITSVEEGRVARELGLEYIVTDHHELAAELPAADVLVHPRLPGSRYPFGELCGAGVAFKLAWQISRRFSGQRTTSPEFQRFLLDATSMAGLGTVCDVVPIVDENRVMVFHGMQSLKRSPPLGLRHLMELAGVADHTELNTGHLAFHIGPRLNACGRLGQARLGVELLVTTDDGRALEIARYLEEENKVRQTLERRILQDARAMLRAQFPTEGQSAPPAIVLASERWHAGVIGIVASRLVEAWHRPCVLISLEDGRGTGSGRSIPGFHLQQALAACGSVLETAGGHAMAAGLRLRSDRLAEFRDRFVEHAASRLRPEDLVSRLHVDFEAPLHLLKPLLVRSLDVLEPFGVGNPAPLLLATGLSVVGEPRCFGDGDRHLEFRVKQNGAAFRSKAFQMADRKDELLSQQGKCCLVFRPTVRHHPDGYQTVELYVKDFVAGSEVP